ncbi:MAG: ABC transporter ATP-binding protein [Liquorilactobacillus ghanensis]|uniref:ATP-binding cassette domain-containing protein n=1 Tax=Liquorilactobacillus ghanensis TaxID=399370 RepID=UPI0039E8A195
MKIYSKNLLKRVGNIKTVLYIFFLLVAYIFYYTQPYLLTKIISKMAKGKPYIYLGVLLLLTMAILPIVNYVSNYFIQSVRKYSKIELWANVEHGGYNYISNKKIGTIQSYVNEVSFACRKLVQESLQSIVKSVAMILLYSIILLRANTMLSFLYVVIIIGYLLLSVKLSSKNRNNIQMSLRYTAKVNEYFLDFYNNKDTIFSLHSLSKEHAIFEDKVERERNIYAKIQKKINISGIIQQLFIIIMAIVIIEFAAHNSSRLVSLTTLLILIYSIINLTNFGSQYLEIFELLDRTKKGLLELNYPVKQVDKKGALNYVVTADNLKVNHIYFKYNNSKEFIFHDTSLLFSKGKRTALIGSNGTGKSTLLKIIAGLLVPQTGNVIVPGKRSKTKIVYLGQDSPLFDRTVLENLMYPNSQISSKYISKLMGEIGIQNLETKPRKVAGDFKSSLSGGEQQKLLIVRTIVQNPDIVLLDEITSNLDAKSAKKTYTMLKEYLPYATIIGIVHKKNELVYFDEIVSIDTKL